MPTIRPRTTRQGTRSLGDLTFYQRMSLIIGYGAPSDSREHVRMFSDWREYLAFYATVSDELLAARAKSHPDRRPFFAERIHRYVKRHGLERLETAEYAEVHGEDA